MKPQRLLMMILALLAAPEALWGQSPEKVPRSGVIVYVKPNCAPCELLKAELKRHYQTDTGRFVIGPEPGAFFRLAPAPRGVAAPMIVFPGRRPVLGYRAGEHARLVNLHPWKKRIKKR